MYRRKFLEIRKDARTNRHHDAMLIACDDTAGRRTVICLFGAVAFGRGTQWALPTNAVRARFFARMKCWDYNHYFSSI